MIQGFNSLGDLTGAAAEYGHTTIELVQKRQVDGAVEGYLPTPIKDAVKIVKNAEHWGSCLTSVSLLSFIAASGMGLTQAIISLLGTTGNSTDPNNPPIISSRDANIIASALGFGSVALLGLTVAAGNCVKRLDKTSENSLNFLGIRRAPPGVAFALAQEVMRNARTEEVRAVSEARQGYDEVSSSCMALDTYFSVNYPGVVPGGDAPDGLDKSYAIVKTRQNPNSFFHSILLTLDNDGTLEPDNAAGATIERIDNAARTIRAGLGASLVEHPEWVNYIKDEMVALYVDAIPAVAPPAALADLVGQARQTINHDTRTSVRNAITPAIYNDYLAKYASIGNEVNNWRPIQLFGNTGVANVIALSKNICVHIFIQGDGKDQLSYRGSIGNHDAPAKTYCVFYNGTDRFSALRPKNQVVVMDQINKIEANAVAVQ